MAGFLTISPHLGGGPPTRARRPAPRLRSTWQGRVSGCDWSAAGTRRHATSAVREASGSTSHTPPRAPHHLRAPFTPVRAPTRLPLGPPKRHRQGPTAGPEPSRSPSGPRTPSIMGGRPARAGGPVPTRGRAAPPPPRPAQSISVVPTPLHRQRTHRQKHQVRWAERRPQRPHDPAHRTHTPGAACRRVRSTRHPPPPRKRKGAGGGRGAGPVHSPTRVKKSPFASGSKLNRFCTCSQMSRPCSSDSACCPSVPHGHETFAVGMWQKLV